MNLSISNSEPGVSSGWRRMLRLYALWTFGIGIVLGGLVLALDPYDTGHFSVFESHGVPQLGPRLAMAGLGRQEQFNTAIFGSSTMQLLDPARIKAKNVHAVSLTISATGPREQFAVAKWFLRHHPKEKARALIFGIDGRWCEPNKALDLTHPFPFWLYSASKFDYAAGMMQFQSLESMGRKIKLLIGSAQSMRADGYNDYDTGHAWDKEGFRKRLGEAGEETEPEAVASQTYYFQAAQLLTDFLAKLPADIDVVLVMPPIYRPEIQGHAAAQRNACRATFKALAEGRANTELLDFTTRKDLASADEDYFDRLHYRSRVARIMEREIGAAIAQND